MPFVNNEQEAACHAQAQRDVAAGYFSRWNCHDFKNQIEGSYNKEWIPLSTKELVVYKGARGGRYRIVNGEKFYARTFKSPTSEKVSAKKPRATAKKAGKRSKIVVGARGGKYTIDANGKKLYIRAKN